MMAQKYFSIHVSDSMVFLLTGRTSCFYSGLFFTSNESNTAVPFSANIARYVPVNVIYIVPSVQSPTVEAIAVCLKEQNHRISLSRKANVGAR